MNTVLVIDDKELMRDSVATTLSRAGFKVVTADSGEAGVAIVAARRPDAVVTDLKMPGMSGVDVLERVREIDQDLPVVVMTAYGSIDSAVSAIKHGAFDYVTKPFEGDDLVISIKRAIQHAAIVRENGVLRAGSPASSEARGIDRILGNSPAIQRVKSQVCAIAESHGNVLVVGESGSGKEVIARAIHDKSPRRDRPFLAVNCAALSESLLESELFGHEQGAFTGAERMRKGRFELADGGTLLLDEISEVSPKIQAKLLRVLQERAFERVGSSVTIGVDTRVIATSNRDLPRSVSAGEFRQDLFFRLNVLPIHLPPLRDRASDVPMLSSAFLASVCAREGRATLVFDDAAMDALMDYGWPGNVRELQNICERAVVLSDRSATVIPASMIRPWIVPSEPGEVVVAPRFRNERTASIGQAPRASRFSDAGLDIPAGHTLEEIERTAILQSLARHDGHRARTAESLGMGVRTLTLKLKRWKEENMVAQDV